MKKITQWSPLSGIYCSSLHLRQDWNDLKFIQMVKWVHSWFDIWSRDNLIHSICLSGNFEWGQTAVALEPFPKPLLTDPGNCNRLLLSKVVKRLRETLPLHRQYQIFSNLKLQSLIEMCSNKQSEQRKHWKCFTELHRGRLSTENYAQPEATSTPISLKHRTVATFMSAVHAVF